MIIKHFVVLLLLIGSTLPAYGQRTGYPFPVLGGTTIRVPSGQDTLWVLKNEQYKRALKIAKRQQIDSLKIDVLEGKIDLYQQIGTEKYSLVLAYKEGYIHYRDLWEKTSFELEEAEVKASKRWRFFEGGFVAGVVSFGATVLIVRSLSK